MLHQSGTGGAPKYGVVAQMPVVGEVENPLSDAMNDTRASPDETEVGYYKASLGSGTILEMGASTKAGLYQYAFPEGEGPYNVLVDVSHVLSSYRGQGIEQHFLGGNISVHKGDSDGDYYYTGSGTYDNVSRIDTAWGFIPSIKPLTSQIIVCRSSAYKSRVGIGPGRGASTSAASSTPLQVTRPSLAPTS
jgi:hypothetical protein